MRPSVERAVRALAAGRLVVFPTDTLLGLGARADDRDAVDRLVALKRRPAGQPLSAAVSSFEELEALGRFSAPARRFVRRHLPGPYTVLVAPSPLARRRLAAAVGGSRTIGLRLPDHPVARELARRAGPIVATSANRHGAPPAPTARAAQRSLGSEVAVYVPDGPAPSGVPSELVDLTGRVARRRSRS